MHKHHALLFAAFLQKKCQHMVNMKMHFEAF